MENSDVVVIRSFGSINEAQIYKTLLEGSGINCALINETAASIYPIQSEWLEVRLVVNEHDVKRAEEILTSNFDQAEFDIESNKRRKKP